MAKGHPSLWGPGWVFLGVICVGFALLTLPHGERQRRVVLEVEEGNTGRDARIKQLEEEAKDKAIEAEVRKAAAQLEKDRAEKMKNRAMAEKTKDKALEDKRRAEEDFKRARDLAGQSARARADGKVAEQKAISMGHVLRLKSAVAKLAEDKAQNERRQADRADEKAQAADKKVAAIKSQILSLRRQARARSTEADARVAVAKKLLGEAKELTVKAQVAQEKALMNKPKTPTVSSEALKMIKQEALRVSNLLKDDSDTLKVEEAKLPEKND